MITCSMKSKPVVTATQMLESMIKAPRPTRAEASDVANAVLDGTDCVMLSGETANGDYPMNAVTIMSKCAAEAERCIDYKRTFNDIKMFTPAPVSTAEALAASAVSTTLDLDIETKDITSLEVICIQIALGFLRQLGCAFREKRGK